VRKSRVFSAIALIAILAAGVTVASVRMHASAQTQPPAQGGQWHHGNRVFGTIQSVAGGSFVVMGRDGKSYTVVTTSGTRVLAAQRGRLSDIKVGDIVHVMATKGQDGSLSAVAVQDLPAGLTLGRGGRSGPRDTNSDRVFVAGSVAGVSGGSLSVTSASGSATTVAVPESARIQRVAVLPVSSLAAGARVSAMGTLNPDGTLSASTVMVMTARR
jgi:hypothetical protein